MKTEMTERDKKLLVFLVLFVIVVGIGYWGVYPMAKAIVDYNGQIAEEQEKKQINDLKIAELPLLEAENVRLEEDIDNAKADYYPMMTSDQVDKMFTGLALTYNLYAYDMDIHMEEDETTLEPYQYSEKATAQSEEDEYYDNGENTGYEASGMDSLSDETFSTGIHTVEISMRLGSDDKDNLMDFINDLSADTEKHLIRNYTWEDNSRSLISLRDGGYDMTTEYEAILNITIDIYMCQE